MKLKISPTLLDALDWWKNAPPSWKQKAYDDIVNKIQRKPFVSTPAIEMGSKFERTVQRACEMKEQFKEITTGSQLFHTVVDKCVGGLWQQWARANIELEDYGVVESYGKLDVHWPATSLARPGGHIIDLKTTANYRGKEKYEKGWQQQFYCHFTGIKTFDYLVAEWADAEAGTIKDVHEIKCVVDLAEAEQRVHDGIRGFFAFLKTQKLWDDYLYIYCKNPR